MDGILQAFITLFVIMDPLGNIPLFISLTKGMPTKEIRRTFNNSIVVAAILLFVFLFFGLEVLNLFGINLNSFQIAGGILLLIIGIMYVLGISNRYLTPESHDLTVPIGTPLLTGPGVITTIIIIVKEYDTAIAVEAAIITLFLSWVILMCSVRLYKILGEHWTAIISRVMGIILSAIAVEFIVNGILNIVRMV